MVSISSVVPLIPKPSDEIDPTPLVTVTPFTEIPEEPIPAPSIVVQTLGPTWMVEIEAIAAG